MARRGATIHLMNYYMITKNSEDFDNIFHQIREDELNPPDLIFFAVGFTDKRVVEGLFDIAKKKGLNLKDMANGDYVDNLLSEALKNENRQASEEIIRVLLENRANPNLEIDGYNFFRTIYEMEINLYNKPDSMAFLQRVRDMLNKFEYNCPFAYKRFRRADQAPRGVGKTQTKKKHRKKKKGSIRKRVKMTRRKVGGAVSIMRKTSLKRRNSPMYKGLGYDMLMAYVYLIKKYKHTLCIAIGDKKTIKGTFDPTYVGLVYERSSNKNVMNYHGGLEELNNFIKKCKKRFFAIPLSIEYPDSGPHFNILIGDNKNKLIERFEPYGAYVDEKVHEHFDKDLKAFLKKFNLYFSYKNPDEFCPASGFQELEENNIQKKKASVRKNDYRGYCGMWSMWFIEMKIRNPDLPSDKLLKKALKEMRRLKDNKKEKFTYRRFVRNYKDHIIEMRSEIMREGGVDCRTGKLSPDYSTFKKCAKTFMDKKLDDFF